jgi:2-keto-4-pentenoate hydratase/2-oxohepta-3-ene-1,7-dioic acid hydratase in catechol pathway
MLHFPDRTLAPCRVFCIGCNYDAHIKEMGHTEADRCVVFMKPATSLVPEGEVVRIPRDRGPLHHEVEVVVAIGTEGKDVPAADALGHVAGVTLGLDLTLRAVQGRLKKGGHPWELSKAFDQSAPLGRFVPPGPGADPDGIAMTCHVNDALRQEGNSRDMLFSVSRLIEILSGTWRLLPGDLIFTGTPPGVGPLEPGDTVRIASPEIGTFTWFLA